MNDVNVWSLQFLVQAVFWIGLMLIAVRIIVKHIKEW